MNEIFRITTNKVLLQSTFIIGIIIFLFGLIGCKSASNDKYEAAVLLPGTVEFFSVEKKGMDRAAAEFGVKLIYADAEWDAGKQMAQVENFVARGVDIILLCARDNKALLPSVEICKEAGIPLITFTNTLGPNPDGQYDGIVSYIGTNELTQGYLQGKMTERLLGNREAKIVLIEGEPGTAPQRLRTEGFINYIKKNPNWEIVYKQAIPGWTKEGALASIEAFLQKNEQVDLVACQWWSAASAAAMALKEAGRDDVYVTGIEFTREVADFIKNGGIDMTTNYSVEECGYTVVKSAYQYLKGENIPGFIEITPIIVDKNNVDTIRAEL